MHAPRRENKRCAPDGASERPHREPEESSLADILVNRLRLLDRVADELAHEVKNPLNAAVINLELLKRRLREGQAEGALERAERVGGEIDRVHALVEALFEILRPDRDGDEEVEVDRTLDALMPVIELQARLGGVAFERERSGAVACVSVDPAVLRQVVLNVVASAIDAAPKGRLALRTHAADGEIVLSMRCTAPADALAGDERWDVVQTLVRDAGGTAAVAPATVGVDGVAEASARIVVRLPRRGRDGRTAAVGAVAADRSREDRPTG